MKTIKHTNYKINHKKVFTKYKKKIFLHTWWSWWDLHFRWIVFADRFSLKAWIFCLRTEETPLSIDDLRLGSGRLPLVGRLRGVVSDSSSLRALGGRLSLRALGGLHNKTYWLYSIYNAIFQHINHHFIITFSKIRVTDVHMESAPEDFLRFA